jgi:DNA-directed RNA polymerase specialized sigma24 family protein
MKRKRKRQTPDEVFAEVEATFRAAVGKFLKQYRKAMFRIYADQIVSAAGVGYMDALSTFDPDLKTEFASWVWTKVWGKMLDELRRHIRRCKKHGWEPLTEFEDHGPTTFDRDEFMAKLSPDGRTVAGIAMDSPIELQFVVAAIDDRDPPSDDNVREAVRQYLMEQGWTKVRVKRAFQEVKDALS